MSRDIGAKILGMVNDAPEGTEIVLQNSIDFARDSLFCEYAYVVDLTRNTLEAYKGFQKSPAPQGPEVLGHDPR